QPLLAFPVELRVFNLVAVRSGQQRRKTHINPDSASRLRQFRFVGNVTAKTGEPLSGFVDNAHRLNRTFDGSVPAHRNTPNTEQLQAPAVQLCPHPELLESEAVE